MYLLFDVCQCILSNFKECRNVPICLIFIGGEAAKMVWTVEGSYIMLRCPIRWTTDADFTGRECEKGLLV